MNDNKKICLIANKPIRWLEEKIREMDADISIVKSGVAHDMDFQSLRIRRHADGNLYMFGDRLDGDGRTWVDCHREYPEIPESRYIYFNSHPILDRNPGLDKYDEVIAMPYASELESYLAMVMYLKLVKFDPSRKIKCIAIDSHAGPVEKLAAYLGGTADLPYFEAEFARIYEERKAKGFASTFPVSRDFNYLQMEARMSNAEFAAYFGTSLRNVENWRKDPSSLRDWIYDLFEYKLLKEGII